MRTIHAAAFAAIAFVCSLSACTANVHDNTVNVDAKLSFKADVAAEGVKPGDSVAVTMDATGVVLVDPKDTPAPADEDKACFFKIFMDDEDGEPLIETAQTSVQVKIPEGTPQGKHHLICRLHKHDGTPTDLEQQVSINVSASASVTVNSDAGVAQP